MAIDERSLGPLYQAVIPLNQDYCPVHVVEIIETSSPWHRGKALVLPWRRAHGLVLGVWWRRRSTTNEDFEDDQWLDPHWLDRVSAEEISHWGLDDETAVAEVEAGV